MPCPPARMAVAVRDVAQGINAEVAHAGQAQLGIVLRAVELQVLIAQQEEPVALQHAVHTHAGGVAPTTGNGGLNADGSTKWQAGDPVYDLLGPAGADSTARKNYSLMDADYDKDTGALGDLPEGVGGKMQPDGTVDDMANAYDGPLPDMSLS